MNATGTRGVRYRYRVRCRKRCFPQAIGDAEIIRRVSTHEARLVKFVRVPIDKSSLPLRRHEKKAAYSVVSVQYEVAYGTCAPREQS